ncbi:MAG: bacillolysin [Frankiales bacterium]|nr:bacillolysin [Frankiales bacterium]
MSSAPRRRAIATLSALGVCLALAQVPAQAGASSGSSRDDLDARSGHSAAFVKHAGTGALRFFGTKPGHAAQRPSEIAASDSPTAAAGKWLARYGGLFGVTDAMRTMKPLRTTRSGKSSLVKLQQTISGLPVVGGELVVTLDDANQLVSVNGEVLPGSTVSTAAPVTKTAAARLAVRAIARSHKGVVLVASSPVLSVLDQRLLGGASLGGTRTVWATTVTSASEQIRHQVFIDATRGGLVLDIDANPQAGKDRVVCNANNHRISDPSCPSTDPSVTQVGTEAAGPSSADADAYNAYRFSGAVYDFYYSLFGRDSIDGAGMRLASTVHFCPPADPGDPSTTCTGYQNAFWDGHEMVYGDGFASALDVVGHELTHGVTEKTSNLFSYYQSGAINESISDVMGELIQQTEGPALNAAAGDTTAYDSAADWILGDKLGGGEFTRSMKDPTADTSAHPDRMTSTHYNALYPWQDGFDGGGVHDNDGVNNKAAYLMAVGTTPASGPFNGESVTPFAGADQLERNVKLANLYYQVESLLTSSSDYADLYTLLPQACDLLVAKGAASLPVPGAANTAMTTGDCDVVRQVVRLTEMNKQPTGAAAKITPEAPVCTNGGNVSQIRLDNFDGTTNPVGPSYLKAHAAVDSHNRNSFGQWWWSKEDIADYGPGAKAPVFASSGSYALYGDDADPTTFDPFNDTYDRQDSWIRTKYAIAARVGTLVRFNHAYEFDYGPISDGGTVYHFDGGRLEYTVDNGAHWLDAGAMIVNGGYNSSVTNTDGFGNGYIDPNPLKGAKAYVGSSHGWTSARVDLSRLSGKSVLLRWRIGSDDAVGSLGWYVDDVKVYNCNPTQILLTGSTEVLYNHAVTLTAKLVRSGTATGVPGRSLQLLSKKHGSSTWTTSGAPKTTNTSGATAWNVTPLEHWDYAVAPSGASTSYLPFGRPAAASKTVLVRIAMTRSAVASTFTLGHSFTVSGVVSPKYTGRTVALQRYTAGAWRNVLTKPLSTSGSYSFTYKPTARGTYSFRVYVVGDAIRLYGVSNFGLKVT